MATTVYVDVLLVTNYIINMLLILCVAKLGGRSPQRRKIVAAALFGSACSLTIFLPFMGVFVSVLTKLAISLAMVRIAFSYLGWRHYLLELALFFGVNFFFAGAMLGIWLAFAPQGMFYYNGIVYFDISSVLLVFTTVLAYLILTAVNRIARRGRLQADVLRVEVHLNGRVCGVRGLVDTGNGLREPFSDAPVMVCGLAQVESLLPEELACDIRLGRYLGGSPKSTALPVRLIPYQHVGGSGVIPAFKPDRLVIHRGGERYQAEEAYVGITREQVGDAGYNAILNPDLISIKIGNGGVDR